ncbi:hypothetical protein T12_2503, partial [Trichinella patagoniensis]
LELDQPMQCPELIYRLTVCSPQPPSSLLQS